MRTVASHLAPVHAADRADLGSVPPEYVFHGSADLSHGGMATCCVDGCGEQVPCAGARDLAQRIQRAPHRIAVALCPKAIQLRQLGPAYLGVVDPQDVNLSVQLRPVAVHAHHGPLTCLDAGLRACCGFFDAHLGDAGLDGAGHAAELFHLGDVCGCPPSQLCGEPFHVVAAAPRVDHPRRARFVLQEQLRVAGDACAEVARQRQRLVEGVGVQALGVPVDGSHRLDARAHHVVVRVLGSERPARGLAMGAQRGRPRVGWLECSDELGPQQPCGPQLRNFHEEVHADAPEEAEARREVVDAHAGADAAAQVFQPVRQRVAELEVGRRPRFTHVVARDRDRVVARHLFGCELEDVADDPHGGLGRVDVGVADHELLEDVVLDGPGELGRCDALLLGGHDIERQHRQHGAVHRHRHAHGIEGDLVEQGAHVQDRVDGHACHADVGRHPGVVGVVAPVGRQVERHRQPSLAGCQVAPVEGVGVLGGGESRVLADRPRLVGVHGRIGAAQVRREAGVAVEIGATRSAVPAGVRVAAVQIGDVRSGVQRCHVDAFGGGRRSG